MRHIFFSLSVIVLSVYSMDLYHYERRLISQNGEDGVLQKIFSLIGTTNNYYVEFGAGDGHLCSNTKLLREKYNWKGLLLDGFYPDNNEINLRRAFITAENICSLFEKYNVPLEFDLISIDIDRNDFYVWKALTKKYKPRVVVIEFNCLFNYDDDKVIAYAAQEKWKGTEVFGASMLALYNLGRSLGYSLVYQESNEVNLFFIRDDVLQQTGIQFKNMNNVPALYTKSPKRLDLSQETFITSAQAMNL